MAKSHETESASPNQITKGTKLKGDIDTDGNIRIDGTIIGTVKCRGKVIIGTTGRIEGEVTCQSADISGEIKAKITVSELLSLKSTAKLEGEIITNKLAIEPGANFSGNCSMGAVIKDIKNEPTQQPQQQPQQETAQA